MAPEQAPPGTGQLAAGALSGRSLTRRAFLTATAGLAGTAYLGDLSGRPFGLSPFRLLAATVGAADFSVDAPDFTIAAERDADLVLLDFNFYGFTLQQVGGSPTLVPTVSTSSSAGATPANYIIVQLPPQCIGEAAYFVEPNAANAQSAAPLPVDPPPIVSAIAGPSRLVFTLTSGVNVPVADMTVAELLDWRQWTLVVPTTAQVNPPGPNGYPSPYDPSPFETKIEFPYALFLAPVVFGSAATGLREQLSPAYDTYFEARTAPLYNGNIADLWTATLARTASLAESLEHLGVPAPEVAAVWAADFYYEAVFAPAPPSVTEADEIAYNPPAPK